MRLGGLQVRPARSELVYRLSYPDHLSSKKIIIFIILNIFIVLYEPRYRESEEKYRKIVQLSHERTCGYDRQFGKTEIPISNTGQSSNDHCGKDGVMDN